jgi:hypothetical protein
MAPSLLTLLTASLAATAAVAAPFSAPGAPPESINYSSAIAALASTAIEPRDPSYFPPPPAPRPRLQFSRIVSKRGRGGKWVSVLPRSERRGEKEPCDEKSTPAPSPPPSRRGRGGALVVAAGNERKKSPAPVKIEKRPGGSSLDPGAVRVTEKGSKPTTPQALVVRPRPGSQVSKVTTKGSSKSEALQSSRAPQAPQAPHAMVIGAEKGVKKPAPFMIEKRPGASTLDRGAVPVTRNPGRTKEATGSGRGGSTVGGAGRGGFVQPTPAPAPAPAPAPVEQAEQALQRGDPRGGARGGRGCSSPRGCFGQGDGAF